MNIATDFTEKFTETKLPTKFGDFKFRVYSDTQGKETIVLYTEKLAKENIKKQQNTPTVRIPIPLEK